MQRLIKIELLEGYKIRLYFQEGYNSEVDFERFFQKGFAKELLDKENFKEVNIESGGGLAWKNGFDFCPNFLYEISRKQIAEHA